MCRGGAGHRDDRDGGGPEEGGREEHGHGLGHAERIGDEAEVCPLSLHNTAARQHSKHIYGQLRRGAAGTPIAGKTPAVLGDYLVGLGLFEVLFVDARCAIRVE